MKWLLRKKTDWKKNVREDEDFNEIIKLVSETPCLAHFVRDLVIIVTTDASRTGVGITLWQKQNDNTFRPIAFGSRYLNDAGNKNLIGRVKIFSSSVGTREFSL